MYQFSLEWPSTNNNRSFLVFIGYVGNTETLDAWCLQLGSNNSIMAPFCCGRRVHQSRSHVVPSAEPDLEDVDVEGCLFDKKQVAHICNICKHYLNILCMCKGHVISAWVHLCTVYVLIYIYVSFHWQTHRLIDSCPHSFMFAYIRKINISLSPNWFWHFIAFDWVHEQEFVQSWQGFFWGGRKPLEIMMQ